MAVAFHWTWDAYCGTPDTVIDRLVEHLRDRDAKA